MEILNFSKENPDLFIPLLARGLNGGEKAFECFLQHFELRNESPACLSRSERAAWNNGVAVHNKLIGYKKDLLTAAFEEKKRRIDAKARAAFVRVMQLSC